MKNEGPSIQDCQAVRGASFGTMRSRVQTASPRFEDSTSCDENASNSSETRKPNGKPLAAALRTVTPGGHNPHVADKGRVPVVCQRCGVGYTISRDRPNRYPRKLCRVCKSIVALENARINKPFTRAESTAAERVRANGLINKRIKDGKLERPKACAFCGKECRPDAHHPDYQNHPERVVWVCRSHHMQAHHRPEFNRQLMAYAVDTGAVDTRYSRRKSIGGPR